MTAKNRLATSPEFVGREREMQTLRSILDEALAGHGRIVMLCGEPGVGKTRAAHQLTLYAENLGARVIWGACYEEEGAPPYWPWVQALRSYIQHREPEILRAEMGPGAAIIAEMVTEIQQKLGDLAPLPTLEPQQASFRLLESISTFLKNAAQSQPMVIILDDLHWAEKSSLMLLEFLARELAETRLLLLGTYRDAGLSMRHPLSQAFGQLIKEDSFQKIQLGGFSQQEVEQFINIAVGAKPSVELVQAIHQKTEGNPLFVNEVVRLLGREGLEAEMSLTDRIPEGVRDAIARGLARLSDPCVHMLTTASVAGREFSFKLLEALNPTSDDSLLDLLDEALSAQFIEELPGDTGLCRFTHALVQDALAAELTQQRRSRLHARIAEALEEIFGEQAEGHAAELAYHYGKAEPVTVTEKLVQYSCLAGNQALATYAYEEALAHFQRGLAAKQRQGSSLNLLDQPSTPSNLPMYMDAEAADLTLGLGLSQVAMLGLQHFPEGVDNLIKAFEHYIEMGEVSKAVAIAQYPFPFWARRIPKVVLLIERALDIVPTDSFEAGRLLCFYGEVTGLDRGDYNGAQDAFDRALAMARDRGDVNLEVRALAWSAMTDCFHLRLTEGLGKGLRATSLALRSNELQVQIDVHHWTAVIMAITGDLENARLKAAAGLELAERVQDRQRMASLLWTNSGVSQMRGDWEIAHRFGDRALENWHLDPRILGNRVVLEYQLGNFAQGKRYLNRLLEATLLAHSGTKIEHAILAMEIPLIARISGVLEMEDRCIGAASEVLSQPATVPLVKMISRIGLALLAVFKDDVEQAKRQYAALKSTLPGIMMVELSGDHLLGLLSQTMGELDRATDHLEDALAFCRNAGCRPELAWTCFDYASTLLQINRPGQDDLINSLLEESLAISSDLAMAPLMEWVIALKEKVEARPPRIPTYPDGLTGREIEVLQLIARGKSNREIAAALIISPNTVVTHVSNIFNKIGAANRTEAASYANRNGLIP